MIHGTLLMKKGGLNGILDDFRRHTIIPGDGNNLNRSDSKQRGHPHGPAAANSSVGPNSKAGTGNQVSMPDSTVLVT